MAGPDIRLRRAYDPPGRAEGHRVLVDRIWPRGLAREALAIDEWLKDLAPSTALRRWYGHDPVKWAAFKARYVAELDASPEAVAPLLARCRKGRVTLVFAARDTEHSNAAALREYLTARIGAVTR